MDLTEPICRRLDDECTIQRDPWIWSLKAIRHTKSKLQGFARFRCLFLAPVSFKGSYYQEIGILMLMYPFLSCLSRSQAIGWVCVVDLCLVRFN